MGAQSVDLLVVGGGVMGLWVATRAVQAGLSTMLIAEGAIGRAGGSANPLGALMPHAPDRWGALAAFQFEALVELEAEAAALQEETDHNVGYARVGRVAPLASPEAIAETERQRGAAMDRWRGADGRIFAMERRDLRSCDRLAAVAAPFGVRADDLTARIAPRAYLTALRARLDICATLREGVSLVGWDGAALLSDGARVSAGALVIAAGAESFPLFERLGVRNAGAAAFGKAIKGQAALFEPPESVREQIAGGPVLYAGGLYIVPHADGDAAVGSTTESSFVAPEQPDAQVNSLVAAAQELCPLLQGLQPARLWAGLRPRTASRAPAIGRVEAATGAPLWAATGGYKISIGIAHLAAKRLVERIYGASSPGWLPEAFAPASALSPRKAVGKSKKARSR